MFSSKNGGKVTVEDKFPCAVCRKDVGSSNFSSIRCMNNVVVLEVK